MKPVIAWAIKDLETGELCHYDDKITISFWKFKKNLEEMYTKDKYKIIKVKITEVRGKA